MALQHEIAKELTMKAMETGYVYKSTGAMGSKQEDVTARNAEAVAAFYHQMLAAVKSGNKKED